MLEMAEKIAENAHNIWAKKKKQELDSIGRVLSLNFPSAFPCL
jgi:hypothetical protein